VHTPRTHEIRTTFENEIPTYLDFEHKNKKNLSIKGGRHITLD